MKLKPRHLLGVACLPIIILLASIYGLMRLVLKVTAGRNLHQEELDILAKDIFEYLKDDIMDYLKINSFPTIGCNNPIKKGIAGRHITIDTSHPWDAYHNQYDISRSHIHETEDWYDGKLVHYEVIYPCVIYERACKNIFIYQYIFISTMVHELTHYRQHLMGTIDDNYVSYNRCMDNYKDYKNQYMEVDANRSARRFIIKNLFTIIKLIYKNSRRY